MIIRYTSDARNDLEEITQHIRAASPSGARKVARRIRSIIELLRSHPRAGRATEVGALNEAVAREGAKAGVPTPVNAVLARLVRAIEGSYDRIVSPAPRA